MAALTTEQVKQRVSAIDNGEYQLASDYTGSKAKITVLHTPCSSLISVVAKGFLNEGKGRCKKCTPIEYSTRGNRQYSEDEIIQRIKDEVGNEYEYMSGFTKVKSPMTLKHTTCGLEFKVTPHMFLNSKKSRCPSCSNANRGVHLRNSNMLNDVLASQPYGKDYEWVDDSEYDFDNKKKRDIKHIVCGNVYQVRPNDFQQGYQCPHCCKYYVIQSEGSKEIQAVLDKYNLDYIMESSYPELRHINPLRFDFDIDLGGGERLIIEFDGEQHFKDSIYNANNAKAYQARDAAKNKFCEERDEFFMHRINYTEKDITVATENILAIYFDID